MTETEGVNSQVVRLTTRAAATTIITTGGIGVLALGILGVTTATRTGSATVACIACTCLALAAIMAMYYVHSVRSREVAADAISGRAEQRKSATSRVSAQAAILVAVIVSLVVQTRFKAGTTIAWGDYTPPEGHAWLAAMFHPWQWTGYNLGVPGNSQTALPWAITVSITHLLGGSAALAQQIWLTTLWASVGVSATILLLVLKLRPIAASIGGLIYAFNPYLLTTAHVLNPVVPAGMLLPPLVLAWAIRAGQSQRTAWWFWLGPIPCAVLLGFVYITPPVAGAVICIILISPLFVGWLFGHEALLRAARRVAVGMALVLGISVYWIVPSILQFTLHVVAVKSLSSTSWESAQGRSTLSNGLWLNTVPLWHVAVYYPSSGAYSKFPLSFLRYSCSIVSFSTLLLVPGLAISKNKAERVAARLVPIAAIVALLVIFLGMGTNFPGSLLFNPLYHLPFGWLLQLPERFLYFAALSYACLVAIVCDTLCRNAMRATSAKGLQRLLAIGRVEFSAISIIAAGVFAPIYPEITGSVIPSHSIRPGTELSKFPSAHIRFPNYWEAMARYLNSSKVAGSVVVLPPHQNYLVPRTWYYGSTSFIQDMVQRPVIDPAASGGYVTFGTNVTEAPAIIAADLVSQDWSAASSILASLDARFVLVSGDVLSSGYNRDLTQRYPASIIRLAIEGDPDLRLADVAGPLSLFVASGASRDGNSGTVVSNRIVTTTSVSPNLQELAWLPKGTKIVTGQALQGIPELTQVKFPKPGENGVSQLSFRENAGRRYSVAKISTNGGEEQRSLIPITLGERVELGGGVLLKGEKDSGQDVIDGVARSKSILPNGTFLSSRGWMIGNCARGLGSRGLGNRVIPNAGPGGRSVLRLSSETGSACRSLTTTWVPHDGSTVFISVWVRHVSGSPPRICLWESAIDSCAPMKALPSSSKWTHIQEAVNVSVASSSLMLFLYGDSPEVGSTLGETISGGRAVTIDEYAGLSVQTLPIDTLAIVGFPVNSGRKTGNALSVSYTTFNVGWTCSGSSRHVLVDGMLNGCLNETAGHASAPTYDPAFTVYLSYLLSGGAAVVVVIGVLIMGMLDRGRMRRADGYV